MYHHGDWSIRPDQAAQSHKFLIKRVCIKCIHFHILSAHSRKTTTQLTFKLCVIKLINDTMLKYKTSAMCLSMDFSLPHNLSSEPSLQLGLKSHTLVLLIQVASDSQDIWESASHRYCTEMLNAIRSSQSELVK